MSAAATRPMRTKVEFDEGTPVVVGLEYTDGTEVPGKGGPQWRYFLTANRIMWVDPVVHALIQKLDLQTRDPIAITKLKKSGRVSWTVERVEDEPLDAQLEQSIANAKNSREERARAELAPGAAPLKPDHQHEATPDEVREANQRARRITPRAAEIAAALMSAIDGARAAEQYAAGLGLKLQFSASDIRAMANTAQIGETR